MKWHFLPETRFDFVEEWPMVDPNEMALILVTYLVFVLKVGPIFMKRRPPFPIKGFLVVYNAIKAVNSSILAFKFLSYIVDKGLFPRQCEHDELTKYRIAQLYWQYMLTKAVDLFDTVIFVVRKKYIQITFLHVYHHAFMVFITWYALKFDPSDHWGFMAFMNCVVHCIMYIYYGMSAIGPEFARFLWWKKYLTMLQLESRGDWMLRHIRNVETQFALVLLHLIIQKATSDCPMRASTYWMSVCNLGLFFLLFADFYKKRYGDNASEKRGNEPVLLACTKHAE